jgi:nicotinamidase/pyrazinamidase
MRCAAWSWCPRRKAPSLATHLLVVDPQNDFCDIDGATLPVKGADADMRRLASFIRDRGDALDAITVTLDSHSPVHVAHPSWWRDASGAAPAPFTAIAAADVQSGRWRTSDPARQAASLAYVRALERGGKYVLVIWPEHCLVGSWGHNIHAAVKHELDAWSRRRLKPVDIVIKGLNPATEHYSAVKAEVPDPADPETGVNVKFVRSIAAADRVLVAGEALSHCVAATVRDLEGEVPGIARRMTLLTDATAPVGGFEALGEGFVADLTAKGMQLATTKDAA